MSIYLKIAIGCWVMSGINLVTMLYHSYKGNDRKANIDAAVGSACAILAGILSVINAGVM